jgi:hypothetical protein
MLRLARLSTALLACTAIGFGTQALAAPAVILYQTRFDPYDVHLRHSPFHLAIFGRLHSQRHKCIVRRRVKLYLKRGDKQRLRDVGRTTRNGAIAVKAGAKAEPDRFILKVPRVRRGNPPYICLSDRWGHRLHD